MIPLANSTVIQDISEAGAGKTSCLINQSINQSGPCALDMDVQNISQMFRALRDAKNISQEKLAELTGVSRGMIARFERGENIGLEKLLQLSNALGFGMVFVPNTVLKEEEE